ncbi:FAD-binding, type 2 [Penicillium griseofulvum]|uniref:FAD-binding, type 2 n=1 Tax=Penicillium patulum TaxID=5078 RepID=A0A135LLJ7_PENPA|nr:FAD-binding, type 2 [Penicillium griseofulvum]KXG49835.1 FAD-binding, type 2 [Penicillium griseofulvum]
MATLDMLKSALRRQATMQESSPKQSLSDSQYSDGLDILLQGTGWMTYQGFIIPQLSELLRSLSNSHMRISVLEIGPGSKSVFGYLPAHTRRRIRKYCAFERNELLATRLEDWFRSTPETEAPLPCLESPPNIHRMAFDLDSKIKSDTGTRTRESEEKFDVILFCHSMYGMKPKVAFIKRALELVERSAGIVVVFHRDKTLHLDGVRNEDEVLDSFAPFIAGFVMQDVEVDKALRVEWCEICRVLGRREDAHPDHLTFESPNIMVAFTQHATSLPELMAQVPLLEGDKTAKNWEARLHHPALVVRPAEITHVQHGHCQLSNVVSIDMSAFDKVHILKAGDCGRESGHDDVPLVIAEAGCKTGDIIRKTMDAGMTVPLGARPSVGAGLWLQGGIGHLARMYGLGCDAIVGAVIVSVHSSQTYYIGHVPIQHRPTDAVRPENEKELLWAIKGASTNFGIVLSVTFKAYAAPTFWTRNWFIPLSDGLEIRHMLSDFDSLTTGKLPQNCSADGYLYWNTGKLHLGVTILEACTTGSRTLGPENTDRALDSVDLFEAELYMTEMRSAHAKIKTSSFKRCLFLKCVGGLNVAGILEAAMKTRPSPLLYLHLVQGGGAVSDVAADETAFGCRDWDFDCVWVYNVARDLLPVSSGVYGADLGPDFRDATLAVKAFGSNLARLSHLKHRVDPHNVLAYACPLPKETRRPKLIILVTGASGAGKDYCAGIWVSALLNCTHKFLTVRIASISSATKREYAAATGADLNRLLQDRAYKEEHRPALTAFFLDQVHYRPRLPEDHFLNVVDSAGDADVLLITGMRDEAPVPAYSHLVPDSRVLDVRVEASKETRRARRRCHSGDGDMPTVKPLDYRPSLVFNNDASGNEEAKRFADDYLLPFFDESLLRLANMVRPAPDFPRLGVEFRHVLNISQQPGGLDLCASLLQTHFSGDWTKIGAIACCETGSFIFASALALRVGVPLALIREAGKLPPPTVSVLKHTSHISNSNEKKIEIERGLIPKGTSVVVVDDVLATGKTLCAVLQLLGEVEIADASVMVVGEFPAHHGRELLRQHGFGVNIQSLLVFDGA